jgi:hypothetical protein
MNAKNEKALYLTRDNFLDVFFDKRDRWSPDAVRVVLKSSQAIDVLFQAMSMYLIEQGYSGLPISSDTSVAPTGQLPLVIGNRIYINLTKLMSEEIKDFLAASVAIISPIITHYFTSNPLPQFVIPAGGILGLAAKVKTRAVALCRKSGEVCVVESIQGNYSSTTERGASAKLINLELTDEPCRYPGQDCQYEADKKCGLKLEIIEKILQRFQEQEVIERCNYKEPPEWKIGPW